MRNTAPEALFPWQEKQWHLLWEAKQKNRLPQAFLFVGAAGLGKMQFAVLFSAAILCAQPTLKNTACGDCHSCCLIRAKAHPDFICVEPEQTGQIIKIDQIRNIVDKASETTMQGGYRIIIIYPAQAMNLYAANALLKTLEETDFKTIFILVSDQNVRLPATIISRCQKVIFQKPARPVALAWLQSQLETPIEASIEIESELLLNLAEGAPLQALALLKKGVGPMRQAIYQGLSALSQGKADPLLLAAQFQEYDLALFFNLFFFWLRDLLWLHTEQQAELVNSDYRAIFLSIIPKLSKKNTINYIEYLHSIFSKTIRTQNLNRQLLLEDLLIRWANYYVPC